MTPVVVAFLLSRVVLSFLLFIFLFDVNRMSGVFFCCVVSSVLSCFVGWWSLVFSCRCFVVAVQPVDMLLVWSGEFPTNKHCLCCFDRATIRQHKQTVQRLLLQPTQMVLLVGIHLIAPSDSWGSPRISR